MTSKDILIEVDDMGGLIALKENDKASFRNSQRTSRIMAEAFKIMRDDILKLQGVDRKGKVARA